VSDGIVSDPATEATVRGLRAATRPTDEPGRLRLIAADTTKRKRRARPQGATLFRNPLIQRAALRVVHRQHVMNTYAANVPGPPVRCTSPAPRC
jgi:hypothetical protein